ncbi:5-oxoprolinase subunit PxpB [uncultured Winogradskyella sp.]|uniref:5-oxoprolinase subunit PxpB n=1 Tax=Winogradskyella sp. 4-2091 TaxID=3381659 RepID=UPI00260AB051|nr:5-oxoprolinase subunit PxpB [uncultured Winogradskyella sp.]
MRYQLRFSQYNERSILVEWPSEISNDILQDVLVFKKIIENNYNKQIIEVISAYNSILIVYVLTIDNVNSTFVELKALSEVEHNSKLETSKTFKIPVCYDAEFAVDLQSFSNAKGLSKHEIIKRHTQEFYSVFFVGFLPGFLYLGGLDSSLHLDRKNTPNLNIKKGSVAIGGKQTGIYPQDSPGGWHIIGNSPVELFSPKRNPPCFIKAGDRVKFYSVSVTEYYRIKSDMMSSSFNVETFLNHG